MAVKIGFNLLAWMANISEDVFPLVDRLHSIGYDGIETPMENRDLDLYRRFARHVHDRGMEVTMVLALGDDENPIDPSPEVRQKGIDRIKWGIDQAQEMGSKVIGGPFHSAFAKFTGVPATEQELEWSIEALSAVGPYAAAADVVMCIEALNRFECYLCNTMAQAVSMVNKVNHPNIQVMFDTHHANMEEKNFRQAIEHVAPVLGHVHISENDRGTPGDGNVPWDETFATLADVGYDGWLTIEGFTRHNTDFANAINVWREFSPPWDMAERGHQFIKSMCEKHGL
ncbi:MAG: sugar phosphate isomerase/epimerase family protein [Bacteroidota bacterium]